MILGPDGRPVSSRPETALVTISWILEEAMAEEKRREEVRRVIALRDSCGVPLSIDGAKIGRVINVRRPDVINVRRPR